MECGQPPSVNIVCVNPLIITNIIIGQESQIDLELLSTKV